LTLSEERAARNEALFREVNERVKEVQAGFGDPDATEFVCECADDGCATRIRVPLATYERVRSNPLHFLVLPGHERGDLEHVVERGEGFLVVEKDIPAAERVAELTDPRR
jgi:hypothetical protein